VVEIEAILFLGHTSGLLLASPKMERVVIDLTQGGDSSEEPVECEICYRVAASLVTYQCCKQQCCLSCYKNMHMGRSTQRLDCPYCRQTPKVDIACIDVNYVTVAGDCGHLLISPFAQFSEIKRLVAKRGMGHFSQLKLNGVTAADHLCLIDTNIESGDMVTLSGVTEV